MLETIQQKRLIMPKETVLVAVSGGADSIALLLILSALQKQLDIELLAAHYEHGIRETASVEDAAFVANFCRERGIRCHVGHGDVPAMAAELRCSLEDAARRARYAFFDQILVEEGAQKLALAHQMEDQAETLLMHLTYGCGLQGLSGMRPLSGNRVRPLLDISRVALEEYLRERGITWREDTTNLDRAYTRNRLRHEVFPLLRSINPQVAQAMARTSALAAQAADTLDALARTQLSGRTKRMPYGAFWQLDGEKMTSEAVRLFAESTGVPRLEAAQTQAVMALMPGKTANLPGDWHALRTAERLHLLHGRAAHRETPEAMFTWNEATPDQRGDGIRTQVLDADASGGAFFRFRQAGDTFAPLGMEGTQKLKQTLQDAGVDRPFRDLLPVLAKGNRILWIAGLKPSRDAAITEQTARAIRIDYHGDLPWEINTTTMEEKTDAEPEDIATVPGS